MKSRIKGAPTSVLLFVLAQLGLPVPAAAQAFAPPQNPSQFDMNGVIQGATLDPTCASTDPLCGGTITINNQVIAVPRNTILQMPAAALTWKEVFTTAPAPYSALGQTGLAMSDTPPPPVQYEAQVVGNRVVDAGGVDNHIAGLIFLSQHSLSSSQGFINFIDYTKAEFRVGGIMNDPACVSGLATCSGQRVKINDPDGTYAAATRGILDVRFTLDPNNPTIRTETGYPMCLPKGAIVDNVTGIPVDPECPSANRPADATSPSGKKMIFTMGPPVLVGGTSYGEPLTDAKKKAPLAVGDYVTYSGILISDAVGPYTAAYQIIDNVGIYTPPGVDPAYVATDVMILGVGGQTVAGLAEATARTRFEGFTTDPTRNILLYGIDVDACSGDQTPRDWGSIDVDPGPPTGAVLGRWRFRPPGKVLTMPSSGAFQPATREMRAALQKAGAPAGTPSDPFVTVNASGQSVTLPGSGYYQAPIFEFLFPENIIPGSPIVPNNFEAIPFLVDGSGPLEGTGPLVGQLAQWPGLPVPQARQCPIGGVPFVTASGPIRSTSTTNVALTGTCTLNGLPCPAPTFNWTQTDTTGFVVNLGNQNALTGAVSFTAPLIPFGPGVTLQFQLQATNGGVASNLAPLAVTLNSAITDAVTGVTATYRVARSRLTVNAGSSVTVAPAGQPLPVLSSQAFDASGKALGPPLPMAPAGAGLYTLDIRGIAQPATVRVTSSYGGVSPLVAVALK